MNRRNFLAATIGGAALTPNIRPVTANNLLRLDIPDPTLEALNTDGVTLFGISPNASVLVGKRDTHEICFLDAETRFPISESSAIPELIIFPDTGIAWSPDGRRIAFDLQAWRTERDSDIFIADVTSGDVINLTPEGHDNEADNLIKEPDVEVDTSPVWLDDDTIVFARHRIHDRDALTCDLCTLTVSTGQVSTLLDLAESGIVFVSSNMWRLSDGSLVFLAVFSGRDIRRGAVMVTPDGEVADIQPGFLETVNYLSVNDSHMVIQDVQAFEWWYIPLDASQAPVPLWEQFELPEGWVNKAFPILGPEPDTMFTVLQTPHRKDSAYLFTPKGDRQLAVLTGVYDHQTSHWSKDSILIAGKSDSWLVPLEGVFG